jgi:hypothetical protein
MIEADELRALCQRIIQSGELGRSRTYAAILEYLAEQAISGSTPKEVSIAMDVLGRGADFDVGKDSIVRVHIYHLRTKLNTYYAKHGRDEKWRLEIPKGQYMLASSHNQQEPSAEPAGLSITGQPLRRKSLAPWLAAVAIAMLGLNLLQSREQTDAFLPNPYADSMLWQPILDDELPVLVLLGDYYIMGELDDSGMITRMVREFDINSRQQLVQSQQAGRIDEPRIVDELTESIEPDEPLADVLVAVPPSAEIELRVVQMHREQPVDSEQIIEPRHRLVIRLRRPEIVPCGEDVAGVETVPDTRGVGDAFSYRGEMLETGAEVRALSSRGLQQGEHLEIRQVVVNPIERFAHARQARFFTGTGVGARMGYEIADFELLTTLQFDLEGIDRLLPEIILRRCKVNQVGIMGNDRPDACLFPPLFP